MPGLKCSFSTYFIVVPSVVSHHKNLEIHYFHMLCFVWPKVNLITDDTSTKLSWIWNPHSLKFSLSFVEWRRDYVIKGAMKGKCIKYILVYIWRAFSLVQLLSRVQLFVTPWTAAHQSSLSITNPRACSNSCPWIQWCHPTISSSVVPFFSCLHSFPSSESFPVSQFFVPGGQSIGVSASASVLPMNIQDWFPLGLTYMISPKDSQESSPTPQFKSINSLALSFPYSPTLTSIHGYWKNHSFTRWTFVRKSNISAV